MKYKIDWQRYLGLGLYGAGLVGSLYNASVGDDVLLVVSVLMFAVGCMVLSIVEDKKKEVV